MGREFVNLFDQWAHSYDNTVSGQDEYHEVFADYEKILNKVAEHAKGTVLEFGVGTGNLTEKLLEKGHQVYGVEPSAAMRAKAKIKFPNLKLVDGDFLQFPKPEETVDTIVSTYAFHHLKDEEKAEAVRNYSQWLPKDGKIVFADTVFENEYRRKQIIERVKEQGYDHLLNDLQTEYYPMLDPLKQMFSVNGFEVEVSSLNHYVWFIHAVKKEQYKRRSP